MLVVVVVVVVVVPHAFVCILFFYLPQRARAVCKFCADKKKATHAFCIASVLSLSLTPSFSALFYSKFESSSSLSQIAGRREKNVLSKEFKRGKREETRAQRASFKYGFIFSRTTKKGRFFLSRKVDLFFDRADISFVFLGTV